MGCEQRELIDVLKRPTSLEDRARGTAENQHRRLCQLSVLDRSERVCTTGTSGDRRDTRYPGQSGHRVGGEDRRRLVSDIDDPDPAPLGADQDGRDVTSAKGEKKPHTVGFEHRGNQIPTIHPAYSSPICG